MELVIKRLSQSFGRSVGLSRGFSGDRRLLRVLLIAGYIVAVLLISGLARS
jgi:predicted transporter